MGVDAESRGKTAVPLGHRIRAGAHRAIRYRGENESVAAYPRVQGRRPFYTPSPVLAENLDELGVQRHPPVLMGLGALFPDLTGNLGDAALEADYAGIEIELRPRSPHTPPRRAPVVMVNQTRVPQSGSFHASVRIVAASAAVGGFGFGRGTFGGSVCSTGFTAIQPNARRGRMRRLGPSVPRPANASEPVRPGRT